MIDFVSWAFPLLMVIALVLLMVTMTCLQSRSLVAHASLLAPAATVSALQIWLWTADADADYIEFFAVGWLGLTSGVAYSRYRRLQALSERVRVLHTREGLALTDLLRNGTIRLLRTRWLLGVQRLRRRQELPEEAFVPPEEAVRLLLASRVGALSYRWLTASCPDPDGFHLEAVRRFARSRLAKRRCTALFIDFASLPQQAEHFKAKAGASTCTPCTPCTPPTLHGAPPWSESGRRVECSRCSTTLRDAERAWGFQLCDGCYDAGGAGVRATADGDRTPEERSMFETALRVMTCLYASPLTIVLQHTRLPAPPLAGSGGTPYARSGWCNMEEAAALLMAQGGVKLYNLDAGDARARTLHPTQRRQYTPEAMAAFFRDESRCEFQGRAVRGEVSTMYAEFFFAMERFDRQHQPCVSRLADSVLHRFIRATARANGPAEDGGDSSRGLALFGLLFNVAVPLAGLDLVAGNVRAVVEDGGVASLARSWLQLFYVALLILAIAFPFFADEYRLYFGYHVRRLCCPCAAATANSRPATASEAEPDERGRVRGSHEPKAPSSVPVAAHRVRVEQKAALSAAV